MNNWLKTIKNFGKKPAPKPRSSGSKPKSNTKKGSHKKSSGKKSR